MVRIKLAKSKLDARRLIQQKGIKIDGETQKDWQKVIKIKKGTGELSGEKLEEVIYEAYGPERIAIIIEGITDNKNRSLGEIRQILNQNNGKLVGEGSVKWLFERKGYVSICFDRQNNISKEDLEITAIEAGAIDICWRDTSQMEIYTNPEKLENIKKILEEKGIKIESASFDWVAKEKIEVAEKTKTNCQKLFEALDENDSVQEIYSNLKL